MSKESVHELGETMQAMISRQISELLNLTGPSTVARTEAKTAYPKFDPVVMRKRLTAVMSVGSIALLCYAGIKGGNDINSIISRMPNSRTRNKLSALRVVFGIKRNAMGNHRAITLSRVMACFPEIVVTIVLHHNPTMIVPYNELKMVHAEFPAIARVEVGASLLPRALKPEERCLAFALFLVSSLKKSEIISVRKKNWIEMDQQEKAVTALGYVERYFDSCVLSDEMRNKEALESGIVISVGTELVLSPAWRAAGACAVTWLKSNYGFDVTKE